MGRKTPVVSAQQNTKIQTTLFLFWLTFLAMIEKRSGHRLKKEIFKSVKNILLTENWSVASIFYEFPKHYMKK